MQGMIYDIIQDSFGFMWFVIKDGFNCYDGYDFKLYSYFFLDFFLFFGYVVNFLFEDFYGRIWVGMYNNGFNIFDCI